MTGRHRKPWFWQWVDKRLYPVVTLGGARYEINVLFAALFLVLFVIAPLCAWIF